MLKILRNALVCVTLIAVSNIAAAQDAKALAKAVKARQGYMQVLSFNLGYLGAMAKGKAPYDARGAVGAANNLFAAASMDTGRMWAKGTDNEMMAGKTAALPAIWADGSEIGQKGDDLMAAAKKLVAEAGKGQAALAAAVGPTGKACGGCHKKFRKKKKK